MIALAEIERARERLAGVALETPLLPVDTDGRTVHAKLECLQPIGSFKLRAAWNAAHAAPREEVARGLVTASAGNMSQGVAWAARALGVPATALIPEGASQTKLAASRRLGSRIVEVTPERWWQIMLDSRVDEVDGHFIHPCSGDAVIAGNGTVGLELLDQLPNVDAILVPWGGGGQACGIASAVKALRPEVRVYAVEPETGAPLAASFAAGEAVAFDGYRSSFVDGAGSPVLIPRMWELARELIDGALVVSLEETAAAIRLLAERLCVVAEGAGALAVAAAGQVDAESVACVVSGGNIDPSVLAPILAGEVPGISREAA